MRTFRSSALILGLSVLGAVMGASVSAQTVNPDDKAVVIVDSAGHPLRSFTQAGRRYLLGSAGDTYAIRITNYSSDGPIEAVISIDGLDAIDGGPASLAKRGYVIASCDTLTITGWRASMNKEDAFTFADSADAHGTLTGYARNLGVIGVALYDDANDPPDEDPGETGCGTFGEHGFENGALVDPNGTDPWEAQNADGGDDDDDDADNNDSDDDADDDDDVRPGMGTAVGAEHPVLDAGEVGFDRAASDPESFYEWRYNDAAGLETVGIAVDPSKNKNDAHLRATARPFP
jgi:hypothetical protein